MPTRDGHGWWPYLVPLFAFLVLGELAGRLPAAVAAWIFPLRVLVPAALLAHFFRQGAYPELRTLYYNECDKLDLDLYDEQPWRPEVWEMLRLAEARGIGLENEPPLLTADEVDGWRVRTLGWFDVHREKAAYQPKHITRERVWPFIPETAARVAAQVADLS